MSELRVPRVLIALGVGLALADEEAARSYRREHGVDPASAGGLLELLGVDLG